MNVGLFFKQSNLVPWRLYLRRKSPRRGEQSRFVSNYESALYPIIKVIVRHLNGICANVLSHWQIILSERQKWDMPCVKKSSVRHFIMMSLPTSGDTSVYVEACHCCSPTSKHTQSDKTNPKSILETCRNTEQEIRNPVWFWSHIFVHGDHGVIGAFRKTFRGETRV